MIPVPNQLAPFVGKGGKIISPWNQYLQQFTQAPPKVLDLIVTASPFAYSAVEPGFIAVAGGTVSAIALTRGTVTIDVTGTKLIPVSINDTVAVTYSGLPDMKFLANFGNRTG